MSQRLRKSARNFAKLPFNSSTFVLGTLHQAKNIAAKSFRIRSLLPIFVSKAVCAGGKAGALSANGCRILLRYLWMKAIIVSSPIPRSWDISACTEPGSKQAVGVWGIRNAEGAPCSVAMIWNSRSSKTFTFYTPNTAARSRNKSRKNSCHINCCTRSTRAWS